MKGRGVAGVVVGLVVLVVGLNLLARALDDAVGGSEPTGDQGSTYATADPGLAAFVDLLARHDHPVRRERGDVLDAPFGSSETVMLIAPSAFLGDDEAEHLADFAAGGGRLVLVETPADVVEAIARARPELAMGVERYEVFGAELSHLRRVETEGRGAFRSVGDGALVGDGDRVLAMEQQHGRGELVLVADASPLENEYLDEADNAAFALALAGDAGRPVTFLEGVHGYGESGGLWEMPGRWKLALLGIVVALVVFGWARGRRLGPPDHPTRVLPPPRAEYVRALGSTLSVSSDRTRGLHAVAAFTRGRVAARAGLRADADRTEVDTAARALGFEEAEIALLWRPPVDDAEVLLLGRAMARVADGRTNG